MTTDKIKRTCTTCIDGEFPCHKYCKGLKCYRPSLDKTFDCNICKNNESTSECYHSDTICIGFEPKTKNNKP